MDQNIWNLPRKPMLAPSVLSADFSDLRSALGKINESGADIVHLDIMDGEFVPNLTFGPPVVQALRPHSPLLFDAHLMVRNPQQLLEPFAKAGVKMLSVHAETNVHLHRILQQIRSLGMFAGVALNPATPPDCLRYVRDCLDFVLVMSVNPGFGGQSFIRSALDKIRTIRDLVGADIPIEVDGGINLATIDEVRQAGADIFVAGSAFFTGGEADPLVQKIRSFID